MEDGMTTLACLAAPFIAAIIAAVLVKIGDK
jgi:hypothetical protein